MTVTPSAADAAEQVDAAPARRRDGIGAFLRRIDGVWYLLVVLLLVGEIINPYFLSAGNISTILVGTVPLVILAVGQAFVMVAGEIDLSVGSTLGLACVISGYFMNSDVAFVFPVILVALVVGAVVGVVNGFLVARFRLSSFIVTLGMMLVIRGIIYVGTNGAPQSNIPPELTTWLTGYLVLGVPITPVVIALVVVAAGVYLAHRSRFGRQLFLTGANQTAARLMDLPVRRTIVLAFVTNGVLAAAAGVYYAAWTGTVQGDQGSGQELQAIAAAVLGGVSLFGGRGHIVGALGGALGLGVIFNLLIVIGLPLQAQEVGEGVVLILAVLTYAAIRRGALRRISVGRFHPFQRTMTDA